MTWCESFRADPRGARVADGHYNRQKVGARQFVPPGACVVLLTPAADALWVTSWPLAEFVKHRWGGAWVNSTFRREGSSRHRHAAGRASDMIRDAIAATRWYWPAPPALGIVTFIDPSEVQSKNPGRTYELAGFSREVCCCPPKRGLCDGSKCDGKTTKGKLAFRLRPEDMPSARAPIGAQSGLALEAGAAC